MNVPVSSQQSRNNGLLAALPREEYQRLLSDMQYVELAGGDVLHEMGDSIRYVYFPNDAVISLISQMKNGATAEAAMVSGEGMVGLHVFWGSDPAMLKAMVQVAGSATRVKANVFKEEFCKSRLFRSLLQRYTQTLLTQTTQSTACNRLHHVQERFAKWLLLLHDRLQKDEFNLTHEIIAQALGVRRAGVSTFALKLRRLGLIDYHRGKIRIVDRSRLEAIACECYEIIKTAFDQFQIALLTEVVANANADTRNTIKDKQARDERERTLETLRDINSRLLIAGIREQEAREEAEAANRAKEEFLATVSHELRTPLNAMLGWSKMLRAGQLDNITAAKALETIERNVESQQRLIESILDFSRITAGKLRLDVRLLDLRPVIEEAVNTVRPAAKTKNIQLRAILDSEPVVVSGDELRLREILWNLLSNSIKFTPEKGTVDIILRRNGSHAQIKVIDSGLGISAEFLPHVFDRFSQADETASRSHDGLGIGLTIVRHLAELHRGTVEAESGGEGTGTTFNVTLPLAAQGVRRKAGGRGKKRASLQVKRRVV
jgi:signal transduction histidine kinase